MPRPNQWIHRLDEISAQLHALDAPVVDRALVELVFGVHRRRAVQLMHLFGGFQAGRTFLVDRLALLRRLMEMRDTPEARREVRRRERLSASLDRSRRDLAARRICLPVSSGASARRVCDLPAGIRLAPGRLEVEFRSAEDLLAKLYELAQAATNDFEDFRTAIEG